MLCMVYSALITLADFRDSKNQGTFSWLHSIPRDDPRVQEVIMNPMREKLRLVGPFLAAHKYFAVDPRSINGRVERKGGLHRSFPNPRIVQWDPSITKACEDGEVSCINEIYRKASIANSVWKLHDTDKYSKHSVFSPFKTELEMFRYRATAVYYMCWFTELKSALLAYVENHEKGCLDSLSKTVESGGKKVVDFRSNYGGNQSDPVSLWTCAYLWFCPDPCYGRSSNGNVKDEMSAKTDPLNPCKNLNDKTCTWITGKNIDFEDLTRNRFNYSCVCDKQGYIWSPRYMFCFDQDECFDQVAQCPDDKICRNTIGSYDCSCRRGYFQHEMTGICVRSPIFKGSLDKVRQRAKKKEKNVPFWVKIMEKILGK
ncbi:uncharacterized protein LOC133187243 [Saccostrea echinata]|uniref:uncharacterized protein LOC133187243 n=1 Tax=Saccostrea echinata TaxID=191078 RepID=UPI002A83F5B2|nr:uncharacterized protein LOC133187243 [Saccostrea echinata]